MSELSVFVVAECLRNLGTAKHHCQEVRENKYEHLKHTLKLLSGRSRGRVKGCELQYFVSQFIISLSWYARCDWSI